MRNLNKNKFTIVQYENQKVQNIHWMLHKCISWKKNLLINEKDIRSSTLPMCLSLAPARLLIIHKAQIILFFLKYRGVRHVPICQHWHDTHTTREDTPNQVYDCKISTWNMPDGRHDLANPQIWLESWN